MDIITIDPSLSLFQQQLSSAVRLKLLSEEGLMRIRIEGAELVERTAEKFFTAMAKEETYTYALRIVDFLLSFSLSQQNTDLSVFETNSLGAILKHGLSALKRVDELRSSYSFPDDRLHQPELVDLRLEVMKKTYKTSDHLKRLEQRLVERLRVESVHRLTEYVIRQSHPYFTGKVGKEFQTRNNGEVDDCNTIIHSYLFSIIFDLDEGYDLTPEIITKAAKKPRPSLSTITEKLNGHVSEIPCEFVNEYTDFTKRFLKHSVIKRFFNGTIKKAERLYMGYEHPLYTLSASEDFTLPEER